jgi:hypothetical protein
MGNAPENLFSRVEPKILVPLASFETPEERWLVQAALIANKGAIVLGPDTLDTVYYNPRNPKARPMVLTADLKAEAAANLDIQATLDTLVNYESWANLNIVPNLTDKSKKYALGLAHTTPERRRWLGNQSDAAFAAWRTCTPQRQLAVRLLSQPANSIWLRILWRFMRLPQGTQTKYHLPDMLRVVLGHFNDTHPDTHLLNLVLIRFGST